MDPKYPEGHPRNVIPELCRQFYSLGWMTGTGGALGVRQGEKLYITPSGVEKEKVQPDQLFIVTVDGTSIEEPEPSKRMRISTCTPLITNVFRLVPKCQTVWIMKRRRFNRRLFWIQTVCKWDHNLGSMAVKGSRYPRKDCGAVYHLHSKAAVMVSLVYPGTTFSITHQKLLQVIRKSNTTVSFGYYDTLTVPIIENKPREDDMEDQMTAAMKDYPECSGLIIRRHGMYVWGPDWEITKAMAEAFDYLFDVATQMKQFGLDPAEIPIPPEGAYI